MRMRISTILIATTIAAVACVWPAVDSYLASAYGVTFGILAAFAGGFTAGSLTARTAGIQTRLTATALGIASLHGLCWWVHNEATTCAGFQNAVDQTYLFEAWLWLDQSHVVDTIAALLLIALGISWFRVDSKALVRLGGVIFVAWFLICLFGYLACASMLVPETHGLP
jgi:hypothetical protein